MTQFNDDTTRELSHRMAGRVPALTIQGTGRYIADPGPPDPTDGKDVTDAIYAFFDVRSRLDSTLRTSTVTILQVAAQTYRVTLNATAYNYVEAGAHTVSEIATGLAAVIDAGSIANASAVGAVITITGKSWADYTIAVTATVDPTDLEITEQDATTCDLEFWGILRGRTDYTFLRNGDETVNYRGLSDRFPVSGLSRFYVRPLTMDGSVSIYTGPEAVEY